VTDEVVREWATARDAATLGGLDGLRGLGAAIVAYERSYLAACRIYLAEQDPRARSSIDHDEPAHPKPIRR
jgi:uridine kinase